MTIQNAFPSLLFNEPLGLVQAPGDASRWFVVERTGQIKAFPNDPMVQPEQVTTFLDLESAIPSSVHSEGETGLLGLAFHPQFSTNGRFYVLYTGQGTGDYKFTIKISEFISSDRETASTSTERVLIQAHKVQSTHNGGQLMFGPDGYLYIGIGDGGDGGGDPEQDAQRTNSLFGKILRIDVDSGTPYGIPEDNPFSGNAMCTVAYTPPNPQEPRNAACPEVYAYGLRNPWRFSFDRAGTTADMWVADVGQGGFEEINRITAPGGNYGWSIKEGDYCYGADSCPSSSNGVPLISPAHAIHHSEVTAIIGGFVYRGTALNGLKGQYIFANYAPGVIYALTSDGAGGFNRQQLAISSMRISTFAESESGEIFLTDLAGGKIFHLTQASGSVNTIPDNLVDTGCVDPINPMMPASGMIPYRPNSPLWSDGAEKQRWMALPEGTSITVTPDGDWIFPPGTVLMKNFRLGKLLVETRLLMRHPDGEWAGYTYKWNAAQTEAIRVYGGATGQFGHLSWQYPSETQCLQCHTSAASGSLGLENGQQNGLLYYNSTQRMGNQILTLKHIGVLPETIPDPSDLPSFPDPFGTASVTERARSYLHSNCSGCHRPGGGTNTNMDLRYTTPIESTNVCNVDPANGNLNISDAKRVAPADPSRSLIYVRMQRHDSFRMPPVGTSVTDTRAVELIEQWIGQMDASCQ